MLIVRPDKNGINKAVAILKNGGVVVYPTDTAYALGGIVGAPAVVKKILLIKGRKDKKFTVVAESLGQVKKFFRLSAVAESLARKYWPGPLSIVVSKNLSVRVPKNDLARWLARRAGAPLVATSANLTGRPSLYGARQVAREFFGREFQPDLLINAGKLSKVKPSTLVRVSKRGIEVLRRGPIKL